MLLFSERSEEKRSEKRVLSQIRPSRAERD